MYRKKRSETKLKKREFHELTCTAIVKSGTIGLRLASGLRRRNRSAAEKHL